MLAPHPLLGICPLLLLHLHQTENKARWRSSLLPPIQVRTYSQWFFSKTWDQFLHRADAIQALVAKYLAGKKRAHQARTHDRGTLVHLRLWAMRVKRLLEPPLLPQ